MANHDWQEGFQIEIYHGYYDELEVRLICDICKLSNQNKHGRPTHWGCVNSWSWPSLHDVYESAIAHMAGHGLEIEH